MLTTTQELAFLKSRLTREDFIAYCDLCASIGERETAGQDDGNVTPGEANGPGSLKVKNQPLGPLPHNATAQDAVTRARRAAAAGFAERFPNALPHRVM